MASSADYMIEGRALNMPCHVRDASSGAALYLVPSAPARALLPGSDYELAEFLPGRAMCALAIIDYKDSDLGDYNEVSIALFVRPSGQKPRLPWVGNWLDMSRNKLGVHILHLPVNQSFTCEAGQKIWGYPKTVQDIAFTYQDDRATCRLVYDGQHAMTLSLPRGGMRTLKNSLMTTYSHIDGGAYVTQAPQNTEGFGTHAGAQTRLELGEGPIADMLRTLGLPRKPITSIWMERMTAVFGAPKAL